MPAHVVGPEVGESIVDAGVAKWLKKEGDAVTVGDALVELETDKIDLEVAAPQAGVLGRITQADGADVKGGDVIGVIQDAASAPASTALSPPAPVAPPPSASPSVSASTPAPPPPPARPPPPA